MSHTPGPWKVTENYRECIEGADGGTVAWYVARANAPLIAAAPDMLAALEAITAKPGPDSWGKVHTAIAKAKGE